SRCPLRQVLIYTDRLKARGHPHELYVFSTGHSSFEVDERTRQIGVILDFLARTVPGIRRLPGVGAVRDEVDGAQLPGTTGAGRMVEAIGIPSTR
ncbi:MAG TPA: hypothetical protein VK831_05980, partial [Candidatus Deferrimicrobiaceae bacterium]|nr:hypothetical protein [Candidatus Deferrimicrobiaceae bacterium]